ncbi:MAG: hypothetical protein A2007_06440 [Verrucomicrobia bacterium GWC2_42_7]|nr:MAG: hypothetical protein A2007_06440 [Verrucomicrobia bacterium GWC2_42_7]
MEKYKQLLNDLAETLHIEALELDENNSACLIFDDSLLILFGFDELRNEIVVKSNMGSIEDEKQPFIYERLLEANLFWHETAGSLFGVENGTVILSQRLNLSHLDRARFENELETFVNVTEYWADTLKTLKNSPQRSEKTVNSVPNFIRA